MVYVFVAVEEASHLGHVVSFVGLEDVPDAGGEVGGGDAGKRLFRRDVRRAELVLRLFERRFSRLPVNMPQ